MTEPGIKITKVVEAVSSDEEPEITKTVLGQITIADDNKQF